VRRYRSVYTLHRGQERNPELENREPVPGPFFDSSGRSTAIDMADFVQQRHKSPTELQRPRELIVACPPMRSNVNLSRIVRAAGCCAVREVICCGTAKVIDKIARDGADTIKIDKFSIASSFCKIEGKGTADALDYTASADLKGLQNFAEQFADLGDYSITGKGTEKGRMSFRDGIIAVKGVSEINKMNISIRR